MKLSWCIGLVFVLSITISSTLAARRLTFRPLSAQEVYRILRDAGREDVVPEGRIITQGIAAVSGFALGLKKGIAVPLAVGLATSNATQEFLNNINYTAITSSLPTIPPITLPTINYTALTSSLPTINYTALTSSLPTFTLPTLNVTALTNLLKGSSSSGSTVQYTTQEICFNSRSLNEIDDEDYENVDDDEVDDVEAELAVSQGRQNTPTAVTTATGTATATQPTATETNSPVATQTNDNTGTVTTVNDGDGTGTNTDTTTETGTGGAINCVVIQKPSVG